MKSILPPGLRISILMKTAILFTIFFLIKSPQVSAVESSKDWTLKSSAKEIATDEDVDLIRNINLKFRSSSQAIDAEVYKREAFPKIGSGDLKKLADLNPLRIVDAFKRCAQDCLPDQGLVENVIKMHLLAVICRDLCFTNSDGEGDQVSREFASLNKDNHLLRDFPEPSLLTQQSHHFVYEDYQLKMKASADPTNNDLYNFRMALGYFLKGMHKTHISTFRVLSRGHKERNFILSLGQDQVLDLLETLRFTDQHIYRLRSSGKFPKATKEFWDYLRNFKFKGSVRMVPAGTVVFKDQPILEIEGNPVDLSILETLISPLINKGSKYATAAAILKESSGGRLLVEAGTRRGEDGFWSSYAAVVSGFDGTSNLAVAYLTGAESYGSQAHQWIGHFSNEVDAHAIYNEYYPGVTLLVDTFDIPEGVRRAVRATGPNFTGIRLDSAIPGLSEDPTEAEYLTVQIVQNVLREVGYDPSRYKILYSNKLSAENLARHTQKKTPFQVAVVGSELAAPSETPHMNVVYKLVETRKISTGEVLKAIKLSSGKTLLPGALQIWRRFGQNGIMIEDWVGLKDEKLPNGYKPLLIDAMIDGVRKIRSLPALELAQSIKSNLASIPLHLRGRKVSEEPYRVQFTTPARSLFEETRLQVSQSAPKYAIYGLSADPIHDGHEQLIRRVAALYGFEKIFIVVTGDQRVHKNPPYFSSEDRLAMVKRRFPDGKAGSAQLVFWEGEVNGHSKYMIDTVDLIRKEIPLGSDLWMIAGEDSFNHLPTWRNPERLINELNWAVVLRSEQERNSNSSRKNLLENLLAQFEKYGSIAIGPHGNRIEQIDLKIHNKSSTQIRERLKRVNTILQFIDPQRTFWKSPDGQIDGALAVPGTEDRAFTDNYALLSWVAKKDPQIKSIVSADSHLLQETTQPEIYSEFANLPKHGIKGVSGPEGDELIQEVQNFPRSKVLEVQHHDLVGGTIQPIEFNDKSYADQINDPRVQIIIRKNGTEKLGEPGTALSVWNNPATEKIYRRISPKTVIVAGVATDYCVKEFLNGLLKLREELPMNIIVVSDAILGIDKKDSEEVVAKMKLEGVEFLKTSEVLSRYGYDQEEVRRNIWNNKKVKKSLKNSATCQDLFSRKSI